MARNGSGTMTASVDFTTEAASPPIEIAKLDTVLSDIADEITNSIAADGQTNPSANLKMNGFRLTNLGAATALTDAARVSELIDQDHIYYVDSGSADTLAITPSPAIAAYEEGQRFVVRVANNNTGATTLNVNALGAIAVQTPDGSALAAGALLAGGIYEFTYDANASPDRWVLTSPASQIADGMLSSNVPLLDATNSFSANNNTFSRAGAVNVNIDNTDDSVSIDIGVTTGSAYLAVATNHGLSIQTNNTSRIDIFNDGSFDFKSGSVTTANDTADEVGYKGVPRDSQTADFTVAASMSGREQVCSSSADDVTVQSDGAPPAGSVVFIKNDTGGSVDIVQGTGMTLTLDGTATTGSRTLAANGRAYIRFESSSTASVGGIGVA